MDKRKKENVMKVSIRQFKYLNLTGIGLNSLLAIMLSDWYALIISALAFYWCWFWYYTFEERFK